MESRSPGSPRPPCKSITRTFRAGKLIYQPGSCGRRRRGVQVLVQRSQVEDLTVEPVAPLAPWARRPRFHVKYAAIKLLYVARAIQGNEPRFISALFMSPKYCWRVNSPPQYLCWCLDRPASVRRTYQVVYTAITGCFRSRPPSVLRAFPPQTCFLWMSAGTELGAIIHVSISVSLPFLKPPRRESERLSSLSWKLARKIAAGSGGTSAPSWHHVHNSRITLVCILLFIVLFWDVAPSEASLGAGVGEDPTSELTVVCEDQ